MPESCADCARRYLGQAYCRLVDARYRHPAYKWIVAGYIACAEEELVGHPDIVMELGAHRKLFEADEEHEIPLLDYIQRVTERETSTSQ